MRPPCTKEKDLLCSPAQMGKYNIRGPGCHLLEVLWYLWSPSKLLCLRESREPFHILKESVNWSNLHLTQVMHMASGGLTLNPRLLLPSQGSLPAPLQPARGSGKGQPPVHSRRSGVWQQCTRKDPGLQAGEPGPKSWPSLTNCGMVNESLLTWGLSFLVWIMGMVSNTTGFLWGLNGLFVNVHKAQCHMLTQKTSVWAGPFHFPVLCPKPCDGLVYCHTPLLTRTSCCETRGKCSLCDTLNNTTNTTPLQKGKSHPHFTPSWHGASCNQEAGHHYLTTPGLGSPPSDLSHSLLPSQHLEAETKARWLSPRMPLPLRDIACVPAALSL